MAKRRGAQFWRAHVDTWRRRDVKQREYCAKNGLAGRAFYRWRRKDKEALGAGNAPLTLVLVSVGTPTTSRVVALHSPGGCRIALAGGKVSWLTELLRHLP